MLYAKVVASNVSGAGYSVRAYPDPDNRDMFDRYDGDSVTVNGATVTTGTTFDITGTDIEINEAGGDTIEIAV